MRAFFTVFNDIQVILELIINWYHYLWHCIHNGANEMWGSGGGWGVGSFSLAYYYDTQPDGNAPYISNVNERISSFILCSCLYLLEQSLPQLAQRLHQTVGGTEGVAGRSNPCRKRSQCWRTKRAGAIEAGLVLYTVYHLWGMGVEYPSYHASQSPW